MHHYLVSGGLGFIGSHLTSLLLRDESAKVTVVDNLQGQVLPLDYLVDEISRGSPGGLSIEVESIADFRRDDPIDTIFHLASVVGPAAVLNHAGDIAESIVRNTYATIRLAQRHGSRLVNISTSEVYGGGVDGLCQEGTPCVIKGPASARQEYAAAKLVCEVAIANLCREGKLDAVTVRPFNVAGVRQLGRGGFVLPRFVGQALLGLSLTVFGDGTQLRAFTDVRDVVKGIQAAARHGLSGTVYNVGNSANRTSILALAELILEETGSRVPIELVNPRTLYGQRFEDAPDKFPDASRLQQLGWEPQFNLRQTVRSVVTAMSQMSPSQVQVIAGLEPPDVETSARAGHEEVAIRLAAV